MTSPNPAPVLPRQLAVAHEQFVFARELADESVVVVLNAADHPASFDVQAPIGARFTYVLNADAAIESRDGRLKGRLRHIGRAFS